MLSGLGLGTMCGAVQDLQRCLAPLTQLDGEDIWEASLLESVGNQPMASLTPAEEALLLSEDPESQRVEAFTHIFLSHQKRTPSLKSQLE